MAAPSAFAGLSILLPPPLSGSPDSCPSSRRSDTTTPRTWSGPSRASSAEPQMAAIMRDVCAKPLKDTRGSRDQTRRKPRFTPAQLDVAPVADWD